MSVLGGDTFSYGIAFAEIGIYGSLFLSTLTYILVKGKETRHFPHEFMTFIYFIGAISSIFSYFAPLNVVLLALDYLINVLWETLPWYFMIEPTRKLLAHHYPTKKQMFFSSLLGKIVFCNYIYFLLLIILVVVYLIVALSGMYVYVVYSHKNDIGIFFNCFSWVNVLLWLIMISVQHRQTQIRLPTSYFICGFFFIFSVIGRTICVALSYIRAYNPHVYIIISIIYIAFSIVFVVVGLLLGQYFGAWWIQLMITTPLEDAINHCHHHQQSDNSFYNPLINNNNDNMTSVSLDPHQKLELDPFSTPQKIEMGTTVYQKIELEPTQQIKY